MVFRQVASSASLVQHSRQIFLKCFIRKARGIMEIIEKKVEDWERVLFCNDDASDYRGIIAIHNTTLGPAVGGTRVWNYANENAALNDALRLSRGMTYKNALAGLPFGGGKSVILADNKNFDRERLFRAHGRFVDQLNGSYITAEDVGTKPADMDYVLMETPHVAGLLSRSGDPSPATARGVMQAILASAKHRWSASNLEGKTIAIQGCGNVGHNLARYLHAAGAKLIVADVDEKKLDQVAKECDARVVDTKEIFSVQADVFSPCALGGILNDETIPQLRAEIVAGAANNQLLEDSHGYALAERGILYAPDYVANAGGIINGCIELLSWTKERAAQRVTQIYETALRVFEIADTEKIPTHKAADKLAENYLESVRRQKD
jgi:leucine dehydrogenase